LIRAFLTHGKISSNSMMDVEVDRRALLKLCGLGAAYGSLGVATATDTHSDRGTAPLVASPGHVPLGPENVLLETDQGQQSLHRRVFDDSDRLTELVAGGAAGSETVQSGDVTLGLTVAAAGHGTLSTRVGGTRSVPQDATLDIWAGAFVEDEDENGDTMPRVRADEPLELTVEHPDGRAEEFTLETDQSGSASLTYDLAERDAQPGGYEVRLARGESGFPPTVEFTVGPAVSLVSPRSFDDVRLVGRETEMAVLAREGAVPQEGVEVTARIEYEGETVTEEALLTDDGGFATFAFTPDRPGTYESVLERDGTEVDSGEFRAVEMTVTSAGPFDSAVAGQESFYGGYLYATSGPVANTEFELRFEGQETVLERTVETDENGFFGVTYEPPADIVEQLEYGTLQVVAELDGSEITVRNSSIGVNPVDPEPFEEDPIQVEIEGKTEGDGPLGQEIAVPGQTATVTLTASADGTVLSNMDVTVAFQFGSGGPVVETRTVTTDADGTASLALDLPDTAPDGATLSVTARGERNGDTYTGSTSGLIQRYDLPLPIDSPLFIPGPGEEGTATLEATDLRTGQPATGRHRQISYEHDTAFDGAFAQISQASGSDGTAEMSFQVSEDIQFTGRVRPYDMYHNGGVSLSLGVDHPGDLSVPDTVRPGEEIELSFDVPGEQIATGFVAVNNRTPLHTIGTTLTSESTVTLEIPEHADDRSPIFDELFDENFLPVYVRARSTDGTLYGGRWRLDLDTDSEQSNGGNDDTDGGSGNGSGGDEGSNGDGSSSEDTSDEDDTAEDDESADDDGAGLGLFAGLAGLGVSGYLASKRSGEDDST
jgi:hypothetical protein